MKTITAEEFKKQYGEVGVKSLSQTPVKKGFFGELGQDIKQTGSNILGVGKERLSNIKESISGNNTVPFETKLQVGGQAAGFVSDVAGEVFKGGVKAVLPQRTEESISSGIKSVTSPIVENPVIQNLMQKYETLKETNPRLARDIDAALGFSNLAVDVIGLGAGKAVTTAGKEVVEQGVKKAEREVIQGLKSSKDSIIEFIAPDADEGTKTILKETPVSKFDEAERIAKEAASDPRKPSSFEVVGEKLSDATKQINNQIKSLSQQKRELISKAKTGLTDFRKETGNVILDINRSLKGSEIANRFISRLKQVKNKIDADKAIDDLQDILYKGNKDMTIPSGSTEDKILKGILGRYNSTLKEGLPVAYKNINDKISNRLKAVEQLNSSLSEVINGVPSRGAGLVKQFFSPAGTKAKQLFEYIKKTTGVDIAQDAVLAKYMAELYGDVKARSLLEGIPTSTTGAIDKAINFAVEKTGLGGKLKELTRKGSILKTRSLTKD